MSLSRYIIRAIVIVISIVCVFQTTFADHTSQVQALVDRCEKIIADKGGTSTIRDAVIAKLQSQSDALLDTDTEKRSVLSDVMDRLQNASTNTGTMTEKERRRVRIEDIFTRLTRADTAINEQRYTDAVIECDGVLALDARNLDARFFRWYALAGSRDYSGAIVAYTNLLERIHTWSDASVDPTMETYTLYNRGVAYHILGQYDAAIADYRTVIDRDSKNLSAYLALAYVYEAIRNVQESFGAYNTVLMMDSGNADALAGKVRLQYISMNSTTPTVSTGTTASGITTKTGSTATGTITKTGSTSTGTTATKTGATTGTGTSATGITIVATGPDANRSVRFSVTNPFVSTTKKKLSSYTWSFGDKTYSTGDKVSHAFGYAGTFIVKVTATYTSGSPETAVTTVIIP